MKSSCSCPREAPSESAFESEHFEGLVGGKIAISPPEAQPPMLRKKPNKYVIIIC